MVRVSYWFDEIKVNDNRVIVANFLRENENKQLHLPYDLIDRLLQTKSKKEFAEVISKTEVTSLFGERVSKNQYGVLFGLYARSEFLINIRIDTRGCVVLEINCTGPMRRCTGEIFYLGGDTSALPTPRTITFFHDSHVDWEDRRPPYSFYQPSPSVSQSPQMEEESPMFHFSCVDRRGYFALNIVPVETYEEAFALYERSFLAKFLSLFR